MLQIIDSGVRLYAIVVETKIKNTLDDFENRGEIGLEVEYFTDTEQAKKWAIS